MANQFIVRYFYSPICPESFASLERLEKLFSQQDNLIFEAFNLAEDKIESQNKWFSEEQKIIDTYNGNGIKPLLYAKLFIEGDEIKGFPPSKKHLQEVLAKHSIDLDLSSYTYNYGVYFERSRIECDTKEFVLKLYNQNNLNDSCKVCTKYHPYLPELSYSTDEWHRFEKQKESFYNKTLKANDIVGVIAYYKDRPIGFIEAFTLKKSIILGFPVSSNDENGLMITCLSVCSEFKGYGLSKKLIKELEITAKLAGYKSLEALTFPDEHGWQPFSLYQKLNFTQNKAFENGLVLVKKEI